LIFSLKWIQSGGISYETIEAVLERAGFTVVNWWGDLTGGEYSANGEWIALAARKK
jgi:hypothetical protein